MSVNEARSAEDATRTVNDFSQRTAVEAQSNRPAQHQVRSSPDNTERHRIIALGLGTALPSFQRPNFVSSENVARVQHLLLSDAHFIQHGTIHQLPDLQQRGQASNPPAVGTRPGPLGVQSPNMSGPGNIRQPPPGMRDAMSQSSDIAAAMAAIESNSMPLEEEEDVPAQVRSYDSSVDDPKTFPVLPSVSRRQSERLDRSVVSGLLCKWSLPDLRKVESSFSSIPALEGITDPDLILRVLSAHPSIDFLCMTPVLRHADANYSPYLMHVVHPGKMDIFNCCVVTRKNVIRYIKGKEPRCLSLKRWSFEQNAMLKMRSIPFFKNFKMMKAFYALASYQDMSMFGKTRRKLRAQLIACNPNYAETLLLVRTMCLDMAALTLIHVDAELTYTLGEFLEEQQQYTQEVTGKIERYLSILLYLISRTCWDDVIGEGLAEESKARRGGAPKRVNELRKMQRLRQSSPGTGSNVLNTDDVNIGNWVTANEFRQREEMERRRRERCSKLSKFIYLVDCLVREALYEVYASSLQKTANFLSLHLETFPSDGAISAIVKGYVGESEDSNLFSTNDDDDDDDGDHGGAPSSRQEGKKDSNKKDQSAKDNDTESRTKTSDHHISEVKFRTTQVQGMIDDQANVSRSRPTTETETSSTWTTLRMSSSVERLGTDTDEFGTPTIMDMALYSQVRDGEAELSDSLDTTSSTFSDDGGNINPMSASEMGNLADTGGDDFNAFMDLRLYVPNQQNIQNQVVHVADQQGTSVEHDTDLDDVTVIERVSVTMQSQQGGSQRTEETNGKSVDAKDNIDDTEEELTITSDEKSSCTNIRKELLSSKANLIEARVTAERLLDGAGSKEYKSKIVKALSQANTLVYSKNASGTVATASSARFFNKHKFVATLSKKAIDSGLTMLPEKGEVFESDSSDSTRTLATEKHPSSGNNVVSLDGENTSTENKKPVIKDEDQYQAKNKSPYHEEEETNHVSGNDLLALKSSNTDQCTSHQARSSNDDGITNDGRLPGIFSGLFGQRFESSVDMTSWVEDHRSSLSFPILDRANWVSGYFGNHTSLRGTRGSSVDENVDLRIGSLPNSANTNEGLVSNDGSTEIVIRTQGKHTKGEKDGQDSEDDITVSFESSASFQDFFTDDRPRKGGDKNVSHYKPSEDSTQEAVKEDKNKSTPGASDKREDEGNLGTIYPVGEYQFVYNDRWLRDDDFPYQNFDITSSLSHTSSQSNVYQNANTSPNNEEEEEKFEPANFLLSDNTETYFQVGNVFGKVRDFPAITQGFEDEVPTRDTLPGLRKDGGKRRKMGKTSQEAAVENNIATVSKTNDSSIINEKQSGSSDHGITITVSTDNPDSFSEKNTMKNNATTSHSSPCLLSEEAVYVKDLQQLFKLLPDSLPLLFKINPSNLSLYKLEHPSLAHDQDIHFTSANSSYLRIVSDSSLTVTEDEFRTMGNVHLNTIASSESGLEEININDGPIRNENDTENDLTESFFESTTEEIIQSNDVVTSSINKVENKVDARDEKVVASVTAGTQGNDDSLQELESDSGENEKGQLENTGDRGGLTGADGGGGGGGGGSGYQPHVKSRWASDLKPMFHASLSIVREIVCITPDVYDFTAASFNIVHDMEMRLRSMDNLTSNPAFLTFTQPTTDGQTSVDKKPRGPNLDRLLRFDNNVTNLKNSVYGSIDNMFHSVAVYTKEMQTLYLRYFKDRHLELHSDHKDVDFYCKHLQRFDVQLKLAEKLPESQRLGMFLIDLTPYKEYVHQCSVDSLQQLQLELNADVVHRIRMLIEKLNDLHTTLESHPTALVPLFKRLTAMDSYNVLLRNVENSEISHIGALYSVIDRFDVPHTEVDRRAFESTHYLITSARHIAEACLPDREGIVDAIDKCLVRDVRYLYVQVKRVVRPLVEAEVLLEGKSDPEQIRQLLIETEDVVRTHVTMANFVREVQRYLGMPITRFTELFNLSSRYVNTRNLWLLMADWDVKFEKWKNQSFQTLDIQEINSYTFKYMEACDKLEKQLPKNTVISVFEEKMDIMLRWLNFIIEFRGQAVKPRHWSQIEEVLGVEFGEQFPLTLASLMSINAIEKQKSLHVILNKARAESNVQNEYDEVGNQCRTLTLPVQTRQKSLVEGEPSVTVYFLGDTFEVEESLNYFVMELERIELSPHSGFLHEVLEDFVQRIFEALEKLVQWMEMQMKLSRLRRLIVRHPEVSETLPAEVSRYKQIYMTYSDFMKTVHPDPSVMRWCRSQDLQQIIDALHDEIVRLYRTFKRDIEVRGGQETNQQDAQQQFGNWVVM